MANADLTAARLREVFDYDSSTGIFIRRIGIKGQAAGTVVGSKHSEGYVEIGIDYGRHYAHRLAWLYVNGEHPAGMIDHIDGDRKNNRIANLRVVDDFGNAHNVRKRKKNSSSLHLGVCWCNKRKKWKAQIQHFKKKTLIGFFDNEGDAATAYESAKIRLHLVAP